MDSAVRIDKWLWAVRFFKTRTLANEACRNGKVTIGSHPVKASRDVKRGDVIQVRYGEITRSVKVLEMLGNRVSATNALSFAEDLTPLEEYKKIEKRKESAFVLRDRGQGRPTKKDRRNIEDFFPDW